MRPGYFPEEEDDEIPVAVQPEEIEPSEPIDSRPSSDVGSAMADVRRARPLFSPDEQRLERAQDRDSKVSNATDVYDSISRAFGGNPAPRKAPNQADHVLKLMAIKKQRTTKDAVGGDLDPNSEASANARDMLRATLPELAAKMPSFERMSEAQIGKLLPFARSMQKPPRAEDPLDTEIKEQKLYDMQHPKVKLPHAGSDPTDPDEIAALRAAGKKMNPGIDWDRMSPATIFKVLRSATTSAKTERTIAEKTPTDIVPLNPAKPIAPFSEDAAKDIRTMRAARGNIHDLAEEARGIIGNGIGFKDISPSSEKGKRLARIFLEGMIQNMTAAGIPNPTDSHIHISEAITGDPLHWTSVVNPQIMKQALDDWEHGANRSIKNKLAVFNASLPGLGGGGGHGAPAAHSQAGPTITVRSKKTGTTKTLPAAQAQKYLTDPTYEQVQ